MCMNNILEVCCGSYYDAQQAYLGGAKRIELNSALSIGGLTPSIVVLDRIKKEFNIEVVCMVRVRGAGFCYDTLDCEIMFEEAELLLNHGADGIVFGFLNADSTVNKQLTKQMVDLVHRYQKTAIFHRAIDVSLDYMEAMQDLIDCGVDRVLTSGATSKAVEGTMKIKQAHDMFKEQIEILVGCGVDESNVTYILQRTGVNQVHSSCKKIMKDATTSTSSVDFSDSITNGYTVCDEEIVKKVLEELNKSK